MTALRQRRPIALRRRSGLGRLRRRLGVRGAAILAGVLVLAGALWLWLRDSPLVAIERVTVSGVSGPGARQIRLALVSAAHGMTTLDVNVARLRTAVSPYPEVKSIRVNAQPPHGLRIEVTEQLPVAEVTLGGRAVAVAGDGTLLRAAGTAALPRLPLPLPPGGPRLTQPGALAVVRALAAAPYRLLARISQATELAGHGVAAQLRDGPVVYLGDGRQLRAKWLAALAVLADPASAGASYIDVSDPARPAAGAGSAGG